MNYFISGLIHGNRTYWLAVLFMVIWVIAIIDVVSDGISGSGLFHGKWFYYTLVMTFASPVIYYIYRLFVDKKTEVKKKDAKEFSTWYEPQQEKKVREMVEKDPTFFTHCYECIYFNERLLECSRKLSSDIRGSRIKEVKINNKMYCLYWEASGVTDNNRGV
jgi:hypothetical protein